MNCQARVEKSTNLKIARNWWLMKVTVEPLTGTHMLQPYNWPIGYGITLLKLCSQRWLYYLYHLQKEKAQDHDGNKIPTSTHHIPKGNSFTCLCNRLQGPLLLWVVTQPVSNFLTQSSQTVIKQTQGTMAARRKFNLAALLAPWSCKFHFKVIS